MPRQRGWFSLKHVSASEPEVFPRVKQANLTRNLAITPRKR
jgi:hypothetical protein